jgi:hypothetical protein
MEAGAECPYPALVRSLMSGFPGAAVALSVPGIALSAENTREASPAALVRAPGPKAGFLRSATVAAHGFTVPNN